MWHFIKILLKIFEVTVYSYDFANKASQSETKIENIYRQCTINIFKLWYLRSCPQCPLNVLMTMNVPVENWGARGFFLFFPA